MVDSIRNRINAPVNIPASNAVIRPGANNMMPFERAERIKIDRPSGEEVFIRSDDRFLSAPAENSLDGRLANFHYSPGLRQVNLNDRLELETQIIEAQKQLAQAIDPENPLSEQEIEVRRLRLESLLSFLEPQKEITQQLQEHNQEVQKSNLGQMESALSISNSIVTSGLLSGR